RMSERLFPRARSRRRRRRAEEVKQLANGAAAAGRVVNTDVEVAFGPVVLDAQQHQAHAVQVALCDLLGNQAYAQALADHVASRLEVGDLQLDGGRTADRLAYIGQELVQGMQGEIAQ